MYCMVCGTLQMIAENCNNCHQSMARYFCGICNFFDDTEGKDIYHCNKCGLCRRGKGLGIDRYHCDDCHICMVISEANHTKHIDRQYDANCPICGEYLFTSRDGIHNPEPCRHPIHIHCFSEYVQHRNYTCPICHKTYDELRRLIERQWSFTSRMVAETPVPDEYQNYRVNILCNDCEQSSEVSWHFFGHECTHCNSFNTSVTENNFEPNEATENNEEVSDGLDGAPLSDEIQELEE
eukprot:TRINITY_DN650_c0_g1_i2.p1 TRINITY_DN650_c0_g1~~TRINITY_DN650_c0_g1_i2.p1  ORF type:complete len:237 (-),score=32.18 TRINITY_DN650_c0_g1_i2:24-734(-)